MGEEGVSGTRGRLIKSSGQRVEEKEERESSRNIRG